mgnify:CR=1 FL=1
MLFDYIKSKVLTVSYLVVVWRGHTISFVRQPIQLVTEQREPCTLPTPLKKG